MEYDLLILYGPPTVAFTAILIGIGVVVGFIAGVDRAEKTIGKVVGDAMNALPPLPELAVRRAHKTAHTEIELAKCIEQGRRDGPRAEALRKRLEWGV